MTKRFNKIFVAITLVLVMVLPLLLAGCGNDGKNKYDGDNDSHSGNSTVTVSSAAVVMNEINEKVEETANKMAASSSGNGDSSLSAMSGVSTLSAGTPTWEQGDVSTYLYANETPMGFIYLLDFVVTNANTDSGYANGFQYNQVYSGSVNVYGYEGIGSFIITYDLNEGVVRALVDFETDDHQVKYIFDLVAEYDFATDTVKKLTILRVDMNYLTDFCFAQYDFVNNNFKEFDSFLNVDYVDYYASEIGMTGTEVAAYHRAHNAELLNKYNNGTLSLSDFISHKWTYVEIIDGNISDSASDLDYYAYTLSPKCASSVTTPAIVERLFNSMYREAQKYSIRTTDIDTSDEIMVTYIQDAADYGFTKSTVDVYTYNGRKYYIYPFIEYETMLSALSEAKTQIYADDDAVDNTKELIDKAYAYISSRGKTHYTMKFGEYGGIDISFEYNTSWDDTRVYTKYKLSCEGIKTVITFTLKNDGTLNSLDYYSLTNSMVRSAAQSIKDGYSYDLLTDRAKAFINNLCNLADNNEPFNPYEYILYMSQGYCSIYDSVTDPDYEGGNYYAYLYFSFDGNHSFVGHAIERTNYM